MPTVTEVLTSVRDILDEPTAAQWTDVMLRKWINEGNQDLARSTRHIKSMETITTVEGQGTYACPASTMAIELAWYHDVPGNRRTPLVARHMENMDPVRGYDWTRQGMPFAYSTQGFSPTLNLIVYPNPQVDDDEILLYIARLPVKFATDGSDDADDIETPEIWFDALADYCEFKALRRDRDPRWQEAFNLYTQKRDGLINNPDYLAVNRELVPDMAGGWLPQWLVEFD